MTEQRTLTGETTGEDRFYYIFYREIQGDSTDLIQEIVTGEDAVEVTSLLNDVVKNASGNHELEELETTGYFNRWITAALDAPNQIQPGQPVPHEIQTVIEDLAENFSDSMKTRARAAGKYVISILGQNRLIMCHSYTGKHALTTELEVIEELLSPDNIDKFAEFTYDSDGDVIVDHFDQYDTESFIEWLGISDDEIVYNVKGAVKLYSEINGEIETIFELSREDVVEKLINSDQYRLSRNVFETPGQDTPTYRVDKIRWGHQTYEDTEEFKQEVLTRHYELKYYAEQYNDLREDLEASIPGVVIDMEDKVVRQGEAKKSIRFRKSHDNFRITCVHDHIELEAGWRKELAQETLTGDERYPLHHPGNPIAETPVKIGSFRIYNDIGISDDMVYDLNDIVAAIRDVSTSNTGRLLKFVVFQLLSENSSGPIQHFFGELADETKSAHMEGVDEGTRFSIKEGGPAGIEMKAGEWLLRENAAIQSEIAEKFRQGVGVVLVGFDENSGRVKAIQKDRFPFERLESIEEHVEQDLDGVNVRLIPVQIRSGDLTLAAVKTAE